MNMRCPNCGAVLTYNSNNNTYLCEYCGFTEVAVKRVIEKVVYKTVVNYNLLLSNQCPAQFAGAVQYSILDTNIRGSLRKDETKTFALAPGPHRINLRIGSRHTIYVIVIVEGEPVKIFYRGGTGFEIEQPYAGEAYKNLKNGKYPSETSGIAIVAMVLSFTVIASFWGVILGAIDVNLANHKGEKPSTTATIAIIVGCLAWPLSFGFLGVIMR